VQRGLTLLIDADDTLWENNVYFEEVIAAFCQLMGARGLDAAVAQRTLTDIERARTRTAGYGVASFRASLRAACRSLLALEAHDGELAEIDRLCAALARRPPLLLPDVPETLRELSGRHRLILFTKGDPDDQYGKLLRSGVARHVHQIDVVREKDEQTYRDAVDRHGISPDRAWMVGNSPKSDIVPALAVGLGAVFIPHHATWELEQGDLPATADGRLLVLDRFGDLVRHF
jgi:putative hydrolase of the HAD superfamily